MLILLVIVNCQNHIRNKTAVDEGLTGQPQCVRNYPWITYK